MRTLGADCSVVIVERRRLNTVVNTGVDCVPITNMVTPVFLVRTGATTAIAAAAAAAATGDTDRGKTTTAPAADERSTDSG